MAISFVRYHGADTATTAGTTLTVSTDAVVAAGSVLVLCAVWDNGQSQGPQSISSVTVPAGETASWIEVSPSWNFGNTGFSAGGIVYGSAWVIKTTTSWASGASCTITWPSTTGDHRLAAFMEFSGCLTDRQGSAQKVQFQKTSGDALNLSTGGAAPDTGQVTIALIGDETTSPPVDSDTLNGTWSGQAFATSSSDMLLQYKILTGGGHQTVNATNAQLGGDGGAIIFTLKPDPGGGGGGPQTIPVGQVVETSLAQTITVSGGGGGGIAFRAADVSVAGNSASSVNISSPAETVAGDFHLLILATAVAASAQTHDTPTGWTLLGSSATSNNMRSSFWWRYAASSGSTQYSLSWSVAEEYRATLATLSGVASTNPIDAASSVTNQSQSPTYTLASISPSTSDALRVGLVGTTSSDPITPPGSWTERLDENLGSGGSRFHRTWYAHIQLSASGATGTADVTLGSSAVGHHMNIAIKTASGGGGGQSIPVAQTTTAHASQAHTRNKRKTLGQARR